MNDEALLVGAIARAEGSGDALAQAFAALRYGAYLGSHDRVREGARPHRSGDRHVGCYRRAIAASLPDGIAGALLFCPRGEAGGITRIRRRGHARQAIFWIMTGCAPGERWKPKPTYTREIGARRSSSRGGGASYSLEDWRMGRGSLVLGLGGDCLLEAGTICRRTTGSRKGAQGSARARLPRLDCGCRADRPCPSSPGNGRRRAKLWVPRRRALDLSEQDRQRLEEGAAHRVLGQVHEAIGNRAEAEAAFRRSSRCWRKSNPSPSWPRRSLPTAASGGRQFAGGSRVDRARPRPLRGNERHRVDRGSARRPQLPVASHPVTSPSAPAG